MSNQEKRFRFGLNLENSSGFEFFNPKKVQSSRRMFTKNPELNERYIQININLVHFWPKYARRGSLRALSSVLAQQEVFILMLT